MLSSTTLFIFITFRNGRKVENYKGARNMDDLADFVNTNKEQAGAAGEAAQDGKVPEQKEPETQVKQGCTMYTFTVYNRIMGFYQRL